MCMLDSYLGEYCLHLRKNELKKTHIIFHEYFMLWSWVEDAFMGRNAPLHEKRDNKKKIAPENPNANLKENDNNSKFLYKKSKK